MLVFAHGGGVTGIQWLEARGADEHPTKPGAVPHNKEMATTLPAPAVRDPVFGMRTFALQESGSLPPPAVVRMEVHSVRSSRGDVRHGTPCTGGPAHRSVSQGLLGRRDREYGRGSNSFAFGGPPQGCGHRSPSGPLLAGLAPRGGASTGRFVASRSPSPSKGPQEGPEEPVSVVLLVSGTPPRAGLLR